MAVSVVLEGNLSDRQTKGILVRKPKVARSARAGRGLTGVDNTGPRRSACSVTE